MQLIGLSGRAGCGKDTVAGYLCREHGFVQLSFAEPMRIGLKAMFGLNDEQLQDRQLKESIIDWIGKSPRQLMQTLGTEWARVCIRDDIWLKVAARRIEAIREKGPCSHINGIVISDVRFENEAEWVREQGGHVWLIKRPIAAGMDSSTANHVSEQQITLRVGDTRIYNNSTFANLHAQIDEAVTSHIGA